ncbi:MAG: DNA-3-methyladenine glycosylase 2 family protein [Thermoleophilia bacterium]|nr:DNA-3-methyladenine glycosylase 2 family protein [Thermoleophilia bacterium]
MVVGDRIVWRTARMPDGPVIARLRQTGEREVECLAWGAGAAQFAAGLGDLLGARDEVEGFDPAHRLVEKLHRAHGWLRVPRTGLVFEALTGAVLEQRVTVEEAFAARTRLLRRHGDAPPAAPPSAPEGMVVHPSGGAWRRVPSWEFHQAGVDTTRAATLLRCAGLAGRLDECAGLETFDAVRRLRAVPGIGVWTAAEVRQRALGDADAVSYGDTHLARFVGYALTGEEVDDHGMQELLAPWAGHRFRVIRLLQLGVAHGVVQTAPVIRKPRRRTHLRF